MNNGIKNKLKELIGKEVELSYNGSGVFISYPPIGQITNMKYQLLRFEGEDCIVLENGKDQRYISTDHIFTIIFPK
jgi:hypothetical protein